MTELGSYRFTRRGLLGSSLAVSAVLMVGCSNDSSSGSSNENQTKTRGGTLRIAETASAPANIDPHSGGVNLAIARAMFDGLVEYDRENKIHPSVAEQVEPENGDPSVWIIRVREGVTFHNGKTLTADDVEFTIRRILDPENPGASAELLRDIDLDKIEKVDERTLRLHLKAPNSQLMEGFAPNYSGIVPVGFDPKKPVGTGPFQQSAFTPKQRWVGKRFDGYWRQEGGAWLDQLELTAFASSGAALNAMLAGQIDAVANLSAAQLPQVKNNPNVKTVESETGLIMMVGMNCRPGHQFEDPRVRQAFRLMIDREQLVNTVYGGHGAVANDVGVFPEWDPAMAQDLPQRKRDIEKAKALLKEAGKENMTVKLRVGQRIAGMVESAQVIQQQAKEVGVTIELDVVGDVSQFFTDAYYDAELQIDKTTTITMYSGAYYYWLSKSGYNSCGYSNPDVDRLFDEAVASVGDEYVAKMQEMAKILYDEGPWIVWGRQNVFDVHSSRVVGIAPDASGEGINANRFWDVAIAK